MRSRGRRRQRPRWCRCTLLCSVRESDASDFTLHPLRHLVQRLDTHRVKQRSAVLKVTIRGVRNHADMAGGFPQHDRVRATRAGQVDARFDQTTPNLTRRAALQRGLPRW